MTMKFDPEELKKAAAEWKAHHALVAAVRRIVRLAGGIQEAKDAIDAVALVDKFEDDMKDEET